MSKPITYWVQNPAIDEFYKEFGSTLERIDRYDALWLMAQLNPQPQQKREPATLPS